MSDYTGFTRAQIRERILNLYGLIQQRNHGQNREEFDHHMCRYTSRMEDADYRAKYQGEIGAEFRSLRGAYAELNQARFALTGYFESDQEARFWAQETANVQRRTFVVIQYPGKGFWFTRATVAERLTDLAIPPQTQYEILIAERGDEPTPFLAFEECMSMPNYLRQTVIAEAVAHG